MEYDKSSANMFKPQVIHAESSGRARVGEEGKRGIMFPEPN